METERKEDAVLVMCPECRGSFYLKSSELGVPRPCPLCGKNVVFTKAETNQVGGENANTASKPEREEMA